MSIAELLDRIYYLPIPIDERFPQQFKAEINEVVYTIELRINMNDKVEETSSEKMLNVIIYDEDLNEILFSSIMQTGYEQQIVSSEGLLFMLGFLEIDIAEENALGQTGDFGTKILGVVRW